MLFFVVEQPPLRFGKTNLDAGQPLGEPRSRGLAHLHAGIHVIDDIAFGNRIRHLCRQYRIGRFKTDGDKFGSLQRLYAQA